MVMVHLALTSKPSDPRLLHVRVVESRPHFQRLRPDQFDRLPRDLADSILGVDIAGQAISLLKFCVTEAKLAP